MPLNLRIPRGKKKDLTDQNPSAPTPATRWNLINNFFLSVRVLGDSLNTKRERKYPLEVTCERNSLFSKALPTDSKQAIGSNRCNEDDLILFKLFIEFIKGMENTFSEIYKKNP